MDPYIVANVKAVLTDDLLKPGYGPKAHCYVASEAIYHLMGGRESGLTPMTIRHEGGVHWYLRMDGEYLDATADQFETPVPYDQGTGRGFLTRQPSKRAAEVIRRVS